MTEELSPKTVFSAIQAQNVPDNLECDFHAWSKDDVQAVYNVPILNEIFLQFDDVTVG